MTSEPSNIELARAAALRARGAWKRARSVIGGFGGLLIALLAMTSHAMFLEWTRTGGLSTSHLLSLLPWLFLAPLAGLAGWLRPLPLSKVAHELDQRAGLDDRISTALEFAASDSEMARVQRADAASVADVSVAPLFPIPWLRGGPWLSTTLLLLLITLGSGLTFDLGRPGPERGVEPGDAAQDLLASIENEKELLLERGDKEGVRLLDDMAREVRKIQARREELKRRIAQRRASAPPPSPEEEEPQLELPAPSSRDSRDRKERGDLITAEDLERLEADMESGMQMSDAQMGDLTSKLFSSTRAAKKLNEEFHHHVEHELEASMNAEKPSMYGTGESQSGKVQNQMDGMDMLNQGAQSDRLGSGAGDVESKGTDMITRDLSAESQAAHDGAHDQQHSFNEFLKDFVKDMQGTVAESAMGKKPSKKGREVQVKTPNTMEDKRDAMAEAGFEEMDEVKRSSGEAPPESQEGAGGDAGGEPGKGPPPENLDNLKASEGEPGDDAIAIKAESAGGQTSAGASGAGTGDPNAAGGMSSRIEALAQLSGPLDEVLGTLGEGSLPSDERKQLFDRLARHKVQAGLASEADDVLLDYFAQAEELIEEEEQFSPLFRDFASSYFDSIRPGRNSRSSTRSPGSSTDESAKLPDDPAGTPTRGVP